MLDLKNKKTKLLIGLGCVGGVIAFSGVGIGVAYAIWHQKKANTIIDGPAWDLNAFESFSTWELATTSDALENPTSCESSVQYNVAGERERKTDELSWFKENILTPKSIVTGNMSGFHTETTIDEDKGMQKDLFSYTYAQIDKVRADGTALVGVVGENYKPVPIVYEHSDKNQSTGKVTTNMHVQYINFSPSFIFDSSFIKPDLTTIKHSDNRTLTTSPRNNIKHEYQIDFTAQGQGEIDQFTINFAGKLLQLLSEGIDGDMEALRFRLTTLAGDDMNNTWDYDQDTHDFKVNLTNDQQKLIPGQTYKMYIDWLRSI